MPEAHAQLMEILRDARAALQGHAGHRVHGRGGAALHAPDAQRQAPGAGRGALRGRRGRRGAAHHARRRSRRSTPSALDALLHPTFDPKAEYEVLATGVTASPGAAKGEIVFTAADAVAAAERGPRRDPRAPVHRGRRRRRLPRRQGHPHLARAARPRTRRWSRAGWAGPAWSAPSDARDRPRARRRSRVNGTSAPRGRPDRDRRHHGLRDASTTCRWSSARSTRTSRRVLEWADEIRRLGVRANADTPEDAQQGARARRRGHRPVPDRAHVHGRGPPAEDAGDDHGRRRGGAPRGAGRAAAAPAGGLRGAVRGDGGPAGDDPPARPAAARVPARTCRTCRRRSSARGSSAPTTSSELETTLERVERDLRGEPDARHARLPARDPLPGDLRDAGRRRSCAPRRSRAHGRAAARSRS